MAGTKIPRECPSCGSRFEVFPSQIKRGGGIYCSNKCRYKPQYDLETTFRNSFTKTERCWLWNGKTDQFGYGMLYYQNGDYAAHRLSYQFYKGEIPSDMVVRHTCDNPPCCNPDHLVLGTQVENVRDRVTRRRNGAWKGAGPRTNLTEQQVSGIRQSYKQGERMIDISKRTGVSYASVEAICKRRNWKHI